MRATIGSTLMRAHRPEREFAEQWDGEMGTVSGSPHPRAASLGESPSRYGGTATTIELLLRRLRLGRRQRLDAEDALHLLLDLGEHRRIVLQEHLRVLA